MGATTLFLFFGFSQSAYASTSVFLGPATSTTWTIDGSPYIIKNNIEIPVGVTLTIDPGVVVKFDPETMGGFHSIDVFGDLVVNGEPGNKVYFTSYYDDSVGGDTNADYVCDPDFTDDFGNFFPGICYSISNPSVGDWQGINFINSHNDYIKNAVFKYANSIAYLDHTYLNLQNVEISNGQYGIMTDVSTIDADGFGCTDVSDCLEAYNLSTVNLKNSSVDSDGGFASIFNSVLNAENLEISNSGSGVIAYLSSNVSLNNINIHNIDGSALTAYGYSTMSVSNGNINDINDDAFGIFDSNITAENLDIQNVTGDNDIAIYGTSHVAVKNSNFKNCPNNSCVVFYGPDDPHSIPASLSVINSTFDGGLGYAFAIYSKIIMNMSQNVIKNFPSLDVLVGNYSGFTINAEDNFWGNDTGPFHPDDNPTGTAGIVSDDVDFLPFCLTEQCKPRNPVILIPGIMGTEIFKNYDDKSEIWPNVNKLIFSITDNFLNDLALNPDGTENTDKPMKLGDIIRGTHLDILGKKYDSKTFEGLITELEGSGYVENTNLFVFPYDWRKSNAESAEKLKDKINKILVDTGADKVDLVAHSMGGLVAKKYIADFGGAKVGQLIFIGTPQLGAPKAFKVIMEGDDMGIDIKNASPFRFLSPSKIKYIVQNMPGVFELLPSKKYIDGQGSFTGEKYLTDYITPSFSNPDNPTRPDLSFGETEDFLKSQKVNTKMLDFSDSLHNDTDNLDLSGVKVSNFVGCGTTKTIGRITVKKKSTGVLFWKKLVNTYDLEYENGDDTVPLHSADDSAGQKYYVKDSTHGELPSAYGLKESVTAILRGKKLTDFPNVSGNRHDCFIRGKTLSFVSLVPTLEYLVYDDSGNYTGPVKSIDLSKVQDPTEVADDGSEIEYGIPGVQYEKISGDTSIFLPAGGNYKIVVKNIPVSGGGGGGGDIINAYNLNIGNINADDTGSGTAYFNNVLVNNPDESFQVEIPANTFPGETNANVPPVVQVDGDGDGTYENQIPPSVVLDETQTNDAVAPSTTSSVAGNTISLSATDNSSGISTIQYSIDGGSTWADYTVPFTVSVIAGGNDVVVQYFATDNAGNAEPVHTLTVSAPPLPVPVVASIPQTRNFGGGMLILSEEKRTDLKGVQDLPLAELVNSNLNLKSEIQEGVIPSIEPQSLVGSLTLAKNSDFKRTVLKRAQEPSLNESQSASAINTNQRMKLLWALLTVLGFIIGISIARKHEKR